MLQWISKNVFYPLWDLKEGADRLAELRRLQQSQYWDASRLHDLQLVRLRALVKHAASQCEYYRRSIGPLAAGLQFNSLDDLAKLPLVSKQDIRERADEFLADSINKRQLTEARTGGSTGRALIVYFDDRCQEYRNAAAMRSDQWAGRDLGSKTAAIWGNPPVYTTWKEKLRNTFLNRLVYLDTMGLNDQSVKQFAQMWRAEQPQVLFGHSHSIYVLATFVKKLGLDHIRPRGIISTSMMLLDNERVVIEEVFQCPVTNRYGCEEVGLIASECPKHDGLHINCEHVIVELLRDDGTPASPGEPGQVVVTDLINHAMPLIRYRVEDVAVEADRPCSCGRQSPLLEKIVGRVADFLVKKDGTLVAGVSLVERTLTKIPGIDQMQIIQEELTRIVVNVVPGAQYSENACAELVAELHEVFGGDVVVQVRVVSSLDQDRSGKYRFSICKVAP
jgi:phenylacetate-CoA ligase